MRIKHIIWTVVLNAFLMLFVSVMMEYNDLSNRLQQVENHITLAIESSVDASMASEEMFTEKFNENVYSQSGKLNTGASLNASSQIRIYRGGKWISGNAYAMALTYTKDGKFPSTESYKANVMSSYNSVSSVYEKLFGVAGSYYNSSGLLWANRNRSIRKESGTINTSLDPTDEFLEFYKNVGYKIRSYQPIKVKNGDTFDTKDANEVTGNKGVPVLANMGLNLGADPITGETYNSPSTTVASDNFCQTIHQGKKIESTGVVKKSIYFLTPYSLGVTYIPKSVVKPMFLANLEQIVRFSKIKTGNIKDASFSSDYSIANGCIQSEVYDGSNTPKEHSGIQKSEYFGSDSDSPYINDGYAEYNMDSVKVKVDYFAVDFGNKSNSDIVNKILGAVSAYDYSGKLKDGYDLGNIVDTFNSSDTGKQYLGSSKVSTNRIVARVTFKMKIQVPFKSGILQWSRYLESKLNKDGGAENHFGIRGLNPHSGKVVITDTDQDGVWFQYTTYRAVTR